ncbi:MAG: RraA family protein [Planctomycetota bacterium]
MNKNRGDQMRPEHGELLELKRWNTPTIYNGWEQITNCDSARENFNLEVCHDYMPQMGPMVGYAVTVVIEPGNPEHVRKNQQAWSEYRQYVASAPSPKIVVVQDLDKPIAFGSFWGEVNSNVHRVLGCVGTITDGAIRDVDEMCNAGFKAIARQLCVGHANVIPVRWDCEVTVFGCRIQPGQLIHADKHGFIAIPECDQGRLLEAARFMDSNECQTLIAAARNSQSKTMKEILQAIDQAAIEFNKNTREKYGDKGEW